MKLRLLSLDVIANNKSSFAAWLSQTYPINLKDIAMLAELSAANAAYATISKFIANGKEISDALALLKNLVGAEEELKARGNRKKMVFFLRSWVSQLMTLMSFWRLSK